MRRPIFSKSFSDKFSKIGRYIYDLAFQYCLYSMKKDSKDKEIRAYLNVLNSRFVFSGEYINSLPKWIVSLIPNSWGWFFGIRAKLGPQK